MTMLRCAMVVLCVAGSAHAEPLDSARVAPAPLLLPDLDARSQLTVSVVPAALLSSNFVTHLEVGATVAVSRRVQVFATAPLRYVNGHDG